MFACVTPWLNNVLIRKTGTYFDNETVSMRMQDFNNDEHEHFNENTKHQNIIILYVVPAHFVDCANILR